jgi:predicted ArsR family transcriptional regulator
MDFQTAAKIGSLIAKDYAEDIFDLLVNYQAISASEVATRLNLHIQTAQDFLEGLAEMGILSKEEIIEKKRPYFRYVLQRKHFTIELDLDQVKRLPIAANLALHIRERQNSGARFSVARIDDYITSVAIWSGEGRERQERKIKLTTPQGRFLFHLPFPRAEALTVEEVMRKAGVEAELAPEILDLEPIRKLY